MTVIPHPAAAAQRAEAPRLLEQVYGAIDARLPGRIPTVPTRDEVAPPIALLQRTFQLVVLLLGGTAMRILERLRLRVLKHLARVAESVFPQAVNQGTREPGVATRAGGRPFRRSFATHLLTPGDDIPIIRELLGRTDVNATTANTHRRDTGGGRGVVSPMDAYHTPGEVRP